MDCNSDIHNELDSKHCLTERNSKIPTSFQNNFTCLLTALTNLIADLKDNLN